MRAYQADCWCDCCGREIENRLRENATPEQLANWACELHYDSDDFPKSAPDDCESDSPLHCASGEDCISAIELPDGSKIGALLSNTLTTDGVEYIRKCICEDGGNPVVQYWKDEFCDYGTVIFEVVVGNVGTIYSGFDRRKAEKAFQTYCEYVDTPGTWGYAEPVTLFCDSEIEEEYFPESYVSE